MPSALNKRLVIEDPKAFMLLGDLTIFEELLSVLVPHFLRCAVPGDVHAARQADLGDPRPEVARSDRDDLYAEAAHFESIKANSFWHFRLG